MKDIPSLDSLFEEYYKAILPLIDEEKAKSLHLYIEDYKQKYSDVLNNRIKEYINISQTHYNNQRMIEEYCALREPLPLTSNFGIHIHSLDTENTYTFIEYTTYIIYAMIQLCNAVIVQGQHQSIQTCFGVCKIAHSHSDTIQHTTDMTHYLIHHNGNFYCIPFFDESGTLYSREAIYEMLKTIVKEKRGESSLVCYVSYMGSEIVVDYISQYMQSPENHHFLETIQNAQFTLVLCDTEYTEEEYTSISYPISSPVWAYSSCSLLIWKNKEITGYFEHTYVDGTTAVAFLEQLASYYMLYKDCIDISHKHTPCRYTALSLPYTKEQHILLEQYKQKAMDIASSLTTLILRFDIRTIRNHYPTDAFIQCMLQYALYTIHGFLSSVYEPVRIKAHEDARVEALRPVSCESLAYIETLYTTKEWNDSLMKTVCNEHKRRITLCQQGRYFSRLFSLLAHLTQGTQAHTFFTTPEFEQLDSDYLVTSNIGSSPYIKHFFYIRELPVHYNVGYMIQDGIATLCFTCNSSYVDMKRLQQGCEEFYHLAYTFCTL